MSDVALVLGGTRSGKSRFAAALARDTGFPVTVVVTAVEGVDPELDARIAAHRRARPAEWRTVDVGIDLAAAITVCPASHVLLVDSLTLWLSLACERGATVDREWPALERALRARQAPVVLVSDEVGLGIVPMSASARAFRDELGLLHQRVAALADRAWLMVAGIALPLKPR